MKTWPVAHRCPWPGCSVAVPAHMWGCKHHWYSIPRHLRQLLWAAYKPGQDASTASREYLAAYAAIDAWIASRAARPGTTPPGAKPDQGELL